MITKTLTLLFLTAAANCQDHHDGHSYSLSTVIKHEAPEKVDYHYHEIESQVKPAPIAPVVQVHAPPKALPPVVATLSTVIDNKPGPIGTIYQEAPERALFTPHEPAPVYESQEPVRAPVQLKIVQQESYHAPTQHRVLQLIQQVPIKPQVIHVTPITSATPVLHQAAIAPVIRYASVSSEYHKDAIVPIAPVLHSVAIAPVIQHSSSIGQQYASAPIHQQHFVEVSHSSFKNEPVEFSHSSFKHEPVEFSHSSFEHEPIQVSHSSFDHEPVQISHSSFEHKPIEVSHSSFKNEPVEFSHSSFEHEPVQSSYTSFKHEPVEISHSSLEHKSAQVSHIPEIHHTSVHHIAESAPLSRHEESLHKESHLTESHHKETSHKDSHHEYYHGHYADYYAYPKYEFQYEVKDPHTHDQKYQHESRDGDVVKGIYSLHEPSGSIRTVKYSSDKKTGFNAEVSHKGHTEHIIPHHHHYHH